MGLLGRLADRLVAIVAPTATAAACSDYTVEEFCWCGGNKAHYRQVHYFGDPWCGERSYTTCYIVYVGCFE